MTETVADKPATRSTPLRQPHPAEGRLDLRQAQGTGLIIGIADPVSVTLDMADNDRIIPHQRDMCGIANVDVAQTGLFKIPYHPETLAIDNGHFRHPGGGIVARV